MEQKQRFINLAQSGRFTVSELSEEFGITRKTGHKWLLRYAGGGMKGLEERSRAPKKVSNRTRGRETQRGRALILDMIPITDSLFAVAFEQI